MLYTGHSLRGVLSFCRDADGVFYTPSRLGKFGKEWKQKKVSIMKIMVIPTEISAPGAVHTNYGAYMKKWASIHGVGRRWLDRFFWDDSEFRIWLFFLSFTPLTFFLSFTLSSIVCWKLQENEGRKEGRKEGRRLGYLWTLTLFGGLMAILWRWKFSWNNRNSHVSQTRRWVILGEL